MLTLMDGTTAGNGMIMTPDLNLCSPSFPRHIVHFPGNLRYFIYIIIILEIDKRDLVRSCGFTLEQHGKRHRERRRKGVSTSGNAAQMGVTFRQSSSTVPLCGDTACAIFSSGTGAY